MDGALTGDTIVLNEIFVQMVAMYGDRIQSQTAYCGYGTSLDRMVSEYYEVAGWDPATRRIIRLMDDMAHRRAMDGA